VGVTLDDVPVGSSAGVTSGFVPELDPGVLQRIEVLRGPQGTLYGASSMGGLLKYVTTPPDLQNTRGQWEVDGLTTNGGGPGYSVRGSVATPIVTDQLALTASAFYRRDPGYVDNTFLNKFSVDTANNYGARLAMLWQIAPGTTLQLAGLYQRILGDGSSYVEVDDSARPINGLSQNQIAGAGPYDRSMQLYSANVNADLGWATLTSVTGYGIYTFHSFIDDTQRLGSYTEAATGESDLGSLNYNINDTRKLSEELRLASSGNRPLSWVAGLFYTKEDSPIFFDLAATNPNTGAFVADILPDGIPENTYKEYAGFADVTYRFTDQFDVQVGGRYSQNRQTYHETIGGPFYTDDPYDVHASSRDHSATYLFTPRYKFSTDLMGYLRIASGYRPGGPNPGAGIGFPSTFHADTTKSYEAGLKGEALNGKLRFDGDVYYIAWNQIQLVQVDPVSQFEYFTNGGKAKSQGVELNVTAAPVKGLALTASLGYTDATLKQDLAGGLIGTSGDRLPYSAKATASLDAEQSFPVFQGAQGFVGGALRYVGARPSNFASVPDVPRLNMPSYTLLDLRAGVLVADWRVSLFAQNVTNRLAILSISPQDGVGYSGINNATVERPRTVGMSVSRSY
jgi:outer membrane receptor protein involved in Fe transport